MEKNEPDFFTIGVFAEKAGVTLRTLRYYDKIALMKPSSYSAAGHRLYSNQDFARLQQILTLKFIGFSLDDIKQIAQSDVTDKNFVKSLEIQKKIMKQRVQHTLMVIKAIDEAIEMENKADVSWDKFTNIINVINSDKKLLEQYENASNLRARMNIHEMYSVNKYGWMRWCFEKLKLPNKCKILELGCGDASLWKKNKDNIPKELDITLSDFSKGMLNDAKINLGKESENFKFQIIDAEDIPCGDCSFDVVIANHMLYHVENIGKALSEIYRVLKPGGYFYSSTVGENHMIEIRDIMVKFKSETMDIRSSDITSRFKLENGVEKLEKLFDNIEMKRYKDNLIVTEATPIIDYIFSMPGNVRQSFNKERLYELTKYLEERIATEGGIYITKDTGFFKSQRGL
ncbi:MerR family transcriptional regulator [Clostridium estertheticum]|uniref:MerR family transcriptional regulator n=1 Tax=Clostridium estertheticum TaxID=238834 RepID=UPI001C0C4745|nr:MerR family transcriptional regulator [Clostridium estertheticum]MBU3217681.1 methyltransferase domain-containing protein [Clostridium estertheticum]WAG55343.1 MerR family transcriptional regulator [Clostridium estertheticum]